MSCISQYEEMADEVFSARLVARRADRLGRGVSGAEDVGRLVGRAELDGDGLVAQLCA